MFYTFFIIEIFIVERIACLLLWCQNIVQQKKRLDWSLFQTSAGGCSRMFTFCVWIVVAFEKKFLEKTWPKGINLHVQKRLHKLLSNKTRLCHIIAYIIKWIFLSDKVQPWKCYLLLPLKLFIAFLILPFMYHPNWHFYDGKDSHTNKTKVEHETCMSTCTLNSWPSICKKQLLI